MIMTGAMSLEEEEFSFIWDVQGSLQIGSRIRAPSKMAKIWREKFG